MALIDEVTQKPEIKTQKAIRILYWFLGAIMMLTLGLAWIWYPEPYEFFQEYISNLGSRISEHEKIPNNTSSLIITIGFGICGLIALIVAIIYLFKPKLKYNFGKSLLNILICIGAIGVGIPKDQPKIHILHGIGAALFLIAFGMLNFVNQRLRFTRKHKQTPYERTKDFYLDSIISIIVFVVLVLFIVFYAIGVLLTSYGLKIIAITFQKVILIVDFFAIFFLDLDDI